MQTVTSADGTPLAVESAGSGPAVILLGGAFNDRSTVAGLAGVLAPSCTVHWYDRRGRGDSGDTPPYAVEREFEDLAAVIAYAGGHAHVFGHSSGAVLALEATARGVAVDRLVGYEPPYVVSDREPSGVDLLDRITALLAAGRRGDAVALFLTESAGVPAPVVESMQGSPEWAWFEAFADSLPRDVALCGPRQALPAERLARIAVPTLVLDGGESPEWLRAAARAVAAAVPGARSETVEGEDHGVLRHPEALVPVLTRFLLR
jgi:pimeloyl-ACP methyl ester carboxylesterase